jgi:NADPH:quinone reductase-like Zn-dependent oxidoreductase
MKAVVFTESGSPEVLKVQEVHKPVPQDNEVLVKIMASSVTAVDRRFRYTHHNHASSNRLQKQLGYYLAGEVEGSVIASNSSKRETKYSAGMSGVRGHMQSINVYGKKES